MSSVRETRIGKRKKVRELKEVRLVAATGWCCCVWLQCRIRGRCGLERWESQEMNPTSRRTDSVQSEMKCRASVRQESGAKLHT